MFRIMEKCTIETTFIPTNLIGRGQDMVHTLKYQVALIASIVTRYRVFACMLKIDPDKINLFAGTFVPHA